MSNNNYSVSQTQNAGRVERDQIQAGRDAVINNVTPKHTQSKVVFQPDTESSSRTVIFISHWSVEKPLALLLADWIKDVFQERFTVFLTSDPNAIMVGEKWMDKIEKALHSAKLALILVSKHSLDRHWVNFEVGFAWGRGIPVVFLCHSGLSPEFLPQPYAARQSLNIQEPGFPEHFLKSLAQIFDIPRLPPLAFTRLENQLIDILNSLR